MEFFLSILIIVVLISTIITINIIERNNNTVISKNRSESLIDINMENSVNKKTYSVIYNNDDYTNLPIRYTEATYAYDTNSPEKAIGVADYAFIAKVNNILRTEYRHPIETIRDEEKVTVWDPYTVYSVTVIENIKGEIVKKQDIEVVQHGGIDIDGNSIVLMEEMKLLNVGEYYILLPYTAEDGRLGISNKTSIVSLGKPTENEITMFDKPDEIITFANELSVRNDRNEISKWNSIYTINQYLKAAENPIVPEAKKETIKSQLYDVEFNG